MATDPMATQQKRAITWVISTTVVLVSAVLGLFSLAMIGFDTGPLGFALGFLLATIPVPLYLLFPLWLDRFEPEPWWLLTLCFLWGAAIATFVSMILNTANIAMFRAAAGDAAGDALGAVISAPLVEEMAKGLVLLLLFFWKHDEFDNVTDGIVYAAMVALGFAMTENIAYYGRAFAMGGSDVTVVFFLRGIMGPFSHPLFTSMTGIGLGAARETNSSWVKWLAPPLGLGFAMLLHAFWNLSASFGAVFFLTYLVVMLPALVAVLVIALFSLRREARVVRLHLESIVDEGVLSGEDLVSLCSVTGRLSSSMGALFSRGFGAWRRRVRFHRAATTFAFHAWRLSRGMDDDADGMRATLLSTLRHARANAGLPPVLAPPPPELVRRLSLEQPLPPELVRRLSLEQPLPERDVAIPPPLALVCTAGPLNGRTFEIGPAGLLFGRDPSMAQVVIADPQISRRHAWVGYRDGNLVAVDRGSSNGTWINGAKVRESRLVAGDKLALGEAIAFDVA
ncbi:MAG: PrsW family intramembrane metalloprotease [Acidobacteria bacterium]|nr:PrsW family intramembrane metalloprotease [Acidobacteriota bacterium]